MSDRYAAFSLPVNAESEIGDIGMAAELLLHRGAQRARALAVYYAHLVKPEHNAFINEKRKLRQRLVNGFAAKIKLCCDIRIGL